MLQRQLWFYSTLSVFISDIDQALALFNELREQDPYRIDNMDTFSNLLYVKVSSPLVMQYFWSMFSFLLYY